MLDISFPGAVFGVALNSSSKLAATGAADFSGLYTFLLVF